MLKSLEILKRQSIEKRNKHKDDSEMSGKLRHELIQKLEKYLSENDAVTLEVGENKLGIFVDLLDAKFLTDYEYVQDEENIFTFRKRVVEI